ncbi:hypothetical protein BcDW1_6406 [Botrytis cinerea BcDW1]|uniref:Uncharacterized protein n=1 Tax=Botryotinia fuckeliana (strain BcDW1) TaxID=1290391 RepID=M7UMR9_BOTF1|nr:hypothetical protein BcDW1_6406 [Botrytis cinerea BcDW1]
MGQWLILKGSNSPRAVAANQHLKSTTSSEFSAFLKFLGLDYIIGFIHLSRFFLVPEINYKVPSTIKRNQRPRDNLLNILNHEYRVNKPNTSPYRTFEFTP